MKKSFFTCLVASLLLSSTPSFSDENSTSDSDVLLTNLGSYLGFDLTGAINKVPTDPRWDLFDGINTSSLLQSAVVAFLGAIPVNAINDTLSALVPDNENYKGLDIINNFSNKTFEVAEYNAGKSGSVTVNDLIDQETFQNDPINQAVLNILGTPDYTYCMNNDKSAWLSDCDYLYNTNVMSNVIGTLPSVNSFFSYSTNEALLPQLNGNSLLGPLLYDTTTTSGSTGNSDNTKDTSKGLTAENQIQQAANFIRYITYGVTPLNLPSQQQYSDIYATATSTDSTVSVKDKVNAQNTLENYLTSLRTFAAQSSVPISNFYYILSKRMPQPAMEGQPAGSQALTEYMMATRRLNNSSTQGTPWIQQINTASPTSVGKEIAVLLAEINYQLYLNRQQQERQLMTESLMLMLALKQQAPDLAESSTTASSDSTITRAEDLQ